MGIPLSLLDPLLACERRLGRRDGAPKGVLIVAAGGLGDTVLFAHVLPRFLALARPDEPVTVVLRRDAAKMAFLFPKNVAVRAVDFRALRKNILYRRRALLDIRALNARLALSVDHLRHPLLDEACWPPGWTAAMLARPWPKYCALDRTGAFTRACWTQARRWSTSCAGPASPPTTAERPPPRARSRSAPFRANPRRRYRAAVLGGGPQAGSARSGAP